MGRLCLGVVAFMHLLAAIGCSAPRVGVLNGRWVAVGGPEGASAGIAAPPTSARPLVVSAPSPGCFDGATLANEFGAVCEINEPEAAGSAAVTDAVTKNDAADDDPTLGNHPTPGEVRWYCDKRTVVRLVIERCAGSNQFRVRQIAVSSAGDR
jgi:hypothetical protein